MLAHLIGKKSKNGLKKMMANNSFCFILEDKVFMNLCESFRLKTTFCNENLFIFNEMFSFIVYDSINDFDMEYIFYDRQGKKYIHGIYAILKIITESNKEVKFISKEYKEINFEKIDVSSTNKKKSFSVLLSIIECFGETIFFNGLNAIDDLYTDAICSVSKKWEFCMDN